MGTSQSARDVTEIEHQLAGVTGRLHAHQDHQQNPGREQELDGQRATFAWFLRLDSEAPMGGVVEPDYAGLEGQFIRAGRASLDGDRRAGGAYEALRWLLGQRGPLFE